MFTRKMTEIPTIKMVMTPFPHSVDVDAPLADARSMMERHDIRHLPVVEGDRLAGVISDRDVSRALDPARGLPPATELRVRDVFVREAYVVDRDEDLDNVLLHMAEQHIGSALVVKEGRLMGIFTVTDACARFGEFLRAWFPRKDGGEAA